MQVQTYSSPAEMRKSYAEVRSRLMKAPRGPEPDPEPEPVKIEEIVERPKDHQAILAPSDISAIFLMMMAMSAFTESQAGDRPPTIRAIKWAVARAFKVTAVDLNSARHGKKFVLPRHVVMVLARNLTSLSLPQIGRALGGRDHTTIMHGVRKMQPVYDRLSVELPENANLDQWVNAFKEALTP